MSRTVVAFGEILWDLLPTGAKLGGAPFNFAYRVNTLGDTGLMVSRLGRDDLGQRAWEQVVALGMETRYLQWEETLPTGTVRILFDADKNPDITILPGVAYDEIEISEPLLTLATAADCFCFGTLVQRAPKSCQTLHRLLDASPQSLKLLDINLRRDCYSLETITHSLERANLLKLNEEEARYLAQLFGLAWRSVPDFVTAILARWPLSCCVVTLGERGAFAASADGPQIYDPGYRVELVDPLGAGDAFTAGFLHHYLRGQSLAECCGFGNVLGAIVSTQEGATAPIAPDTISNFLATHASRISDESLRLFTAP